MIPNLCGWSSPKTLKPAAFLKAVVTAQSGMAKLASDHASAQIYLMGNLSRDMFEAQARLASALGAPEKLEALRPDAELGSAVTSYSETAGALLRSFVEEAVEMGSRHMEKAA